MSGVNLNIMVYRSVSVKQIPFLYIIIVIFKLIYHIFICFQLKVYYPYWVKFGPWAFHIHIYMKLKEWWVFNYHAVMFDTYIMYLISDLSHQCV